MSAPVGVRLRRRARHGPALVRSAALGARAVATARVGAGREPRDATVLPDGWTVLHQPSIDGLDDVLASLRAAARTWARPATSHRSHLLPEPVDVRDLDPAAPLARVLRAPELLGAASRHLGEEPVVAHVAVWRAWRAEGPPSSTQQWHCDDDDHHQVKAFIAVGDITPDHGPLTVMGARASRRARRALHHRLDPERVFVDDDALAAVVDPAEATALCAAAGDVALVDTSACLHQGGRVVGADLVRTTLVVQYLRRRALTIPLRDPVGRWQR